ncbi:MAG: thioesterase family protein [Paludibacter sp.]
MKNQLTQNIVVSKKQTAEHLGSGLLPVFSTPALVAFMENTAMKLIELPEGSSSVGVSIHIKHLKASPVGEKISCTATLIGNEGRKHVFALEATDSHGDLIGQGTHERMVIDIQKFMSKIK